MLTWNFVFPDVRLTRAPGVLFIGPAEYSAVMCGAFPRTWAMWQWLRLSMICCCALRPWSRTGVIYQRADFWIWSSCIVVPGWNAAGPWDGCIYMRDGYGEFRQPKFECSCCEMLVFRVRGARQNFYVFSLYRNPYLDDRIYDCLLTAWQPCRQRMRVPRSFLWVTWMAIIRNGWVLLPRTVMVLRPRFCQCQVLFNWWLAQLMHVEELLTSWWLMFLK